VVLAGAVVLVAAWVVVGLVAGAVVVGVVVVPPQLMKMRELTTMIVRARNNLFIDNLLISLNVSLCLRISKGSGLQAAVYF
jgi:hypothetical protein